MKKVKVELEAYLEDAYFRVIPIQKARGVDVSRREEVVEDLHNFLDAIPAHIEIENGQYESIIRWIDADLGHIGSQYQFSRQTEISILTYINSCYASRRL